MNTVIDKPAPDFTAIKQRQQATWASGDYAAIGTTLQIVGETLAEAADVRAGEAVLDVAAGNGNASLAAARRHAVVTSTDYVQSLLDKGRARAQAEELPMRVSAGRCRGAALRRRQLRRRAVHLRRHVHARPPPRRQRDAARAAPGRPHRDGELDARRLHRPPVQGDRRPRQPARRRAAAVAVGHRAAHRRTVRRRRPRRSVASAGTSTSATARRRTGCRSSATCTARCTRPSARSTPPVPRRSSAPSRRCSNELNVAGPDSLVVPSEYLEIVVTKH